MPAASFGITFEGYWREENEGGVPSMSGIYCVYGCVDNPSANAVSLNAIIYIGEADDVKTRIANHEKLPEWNRHLKQGEELCYSFGHVSPADRRRCEAAMIFQHQPPVNNEYKLAFPFDQTTISLSGQIARLHPNFTVRRTP
jgi:hypothetical protein